MFGFFLIGRILGDSGGFPIWSERSAVFRFVQVCSDLFRFVRGAPEALTVKVDNGVDGMVGAVAIAPYFAWVWGEGGG